ncbi:hypothetical protein BH11BAC2_BH11BAC2_20990 [soil metagenome]
MDVNTTLNTLVLYLYNETEMTESVMVQRAIDTDWETAETFQDLVTIKELIENSLLSPGKSARESILSYAKLTAPLSVRA